MTEDELERELQWLRQNQAALDLRLARVEDSIVFRMLRAIGRFYGTRMAAVKKGSPHGYEAWKKRAGAEAGPEREPVSHPKISVVGQPDARGAASLQAQTYREWELVASVAEASGDWICFLGERDFLSATALAHIADRAEGHDLIYSDEEIVGAESRPVFKPGWSPLLLRSVNYLGGLLAVRRDRLLLAGSLEALLREPLQVAHVARLLYHGPGGVRPLQLAPAGVAGCSSKSVDSDLYADQRSAPKLSFGPRGEDRLCGARSDCGAACRHRRRRGRGICN